MQRARFQADRRTGGGAPCFAARPLRAQQQGRGIRCRDSRRERTRAGLAAKDAQFSGASNEPGFRPIGARGAELRVLQRARGDRARILGTGRIRTLAQLRVFSADADYRQPEKVANIAQITTR